MKKSFLQRSFLVSIGLIFVLVVLASSCSLSSTPERSSSPTTTAQEIAFATGTVGPTKTLLPRPTIHLTETLSPSPTIHPTENIAPTSPVIQSKAFIPIVLNGKLNQVESIEPAQTNASLQVHFIDVGQGDSILVWLPGSEAVLIDGGESGSGALQYLQSRGIDHLDLVVATHAHSDHVGGLVDVLQAIPVDRVVTNRGTKSTYFYKLFLKSVASSGAEVSEVKRGDTITVGNLDFEVLNPGDSPCDDLNDCSIVLRLVYGSTGFLFTADAEKRAEEDMLSSGLPLNADILKVGHHGNSSSSSPAFLSAVMPEIAVYSAAAGNAFGDPHSETLAALESVGAEIYGTDQYGTIVITSDGRGYSVQTSKQAEPQAPSTVESTVQPAASQPPTAAPR